MRKFLFIIIAITLKCSAQTTNIVVNNVNNASTNETEYYINGIPKSADIGGVDLTSTSVSGTRAVNNHGFASNDPINYITSLTLTNYNQSAVTVILKVNFKTTVGMRPYPRYYDEEERIYNIVLGGADKHNSTKSIPCSQGDSYQCDVIEADMIVRKVKN